MRKIKFIIAFWVIIGTMIYSCQKDNDSFSNGFDDAQTLIQLSQIDFEVFTMEDNVVKNSFNTGTDVIFVLKIINRSKKGFEWYYGDGCGAQQQEDFFLVKNKNNTEGSVIPLGKPYIPAMCLAINLPPEIIEPGEEILMLYRWSDNPDNVELSSGEYFTEFTLTINRKDYQKSWNLRAEFIIH
jgi:hypothetical protein